jgi:hypothetical protein
MATTPNAPHNRSRPPKRIRIPALSTLDLEAEQHRNLRGARRRLRNIEQKLNEAWIMLATTPPEVDQALRQDLWKAMELIARTNKRLILKRGRKPAGRPRSSLPAQDAL